MTQERDAGSFPSHFSQSPGQELEERRLHRSKQEMSDRTSVDRHLMTTHYQGEGRKRVYKQGLEAK